MGTSALQPQLVFSRDKRSVSWGDRFLIFDMKSIIFGRGVVIRSSINSGFLVYFKECSCSLPTITPAAPVKRLVGMRTCWCLSSNAFVSKSHCLNKNVTISLKVHWTESAHRILTLNFVESNWLLEKQQSPIIHVLLLPCSLLFDDWKFWSWNLLFITEHNLLDLRNKTWFSIEFYRHKNVHFIHVYFAFQIYKTLITHFQLIRDHYYREECVWNFRPLFGTRHRYT